MSVRQIHQIICDNGGCGEVFVARELTAGRELTATETRRAARFAGWWVRTNGTGTGRFDVCPRCQPSAGSVPSGVIQL